MSTLHKNIFRGDQILVFPLLSFLSLKLSDAVCLCLPLQEVRNKCWRASLSSPTSTSLVPAVSSILPLSASAGLLRPYPSGLISNLRTSAGDGVATGLQQLSALTEHPCHNAPRFLPMYALLHPGPLGLLSCWFVTSYQCIRRKHNGQKHFSFTNSLEFIS